MDLTKKEMLILHTALDSRIEDVNSAILYYRKLNSQHPFFLSHMSGYVNEKEIIEELINRIEKEVSDDAR